MKINATFRRASTKMSKDIFFDVDVLNYFDWGVVGSWDWFRLQVGLQFPFQNIVGKLFQIVNTENRNIKLKTIHIMLTGIIFEPT